ncbi:MAG: type II secretion system protein [Firmicutes bacterium]|nr:type II secretion system protein [Bacillota bacterium]
MNKKGFTLIELLAVIVVLAIIALIATPIVMGVIEKAQIGANERSVEGYMKAYEAAYYQYMLEHDGEKPTAALTPEYSGAVVNCGTPTVTEDSKFTATCTVGDDTEQEYEYVGGKATAK